MKKILKITGYTVFFLLIIYLIATMFVPEIVDKGHNKIRQLPPYKVSAKAQDLYNSLDLSPICIVMHFCGNVIYLRTMILAR